MSQYVFTYDYFIHKTKIELHMNFNLKPDEIKLLYLSRNIFIAIVIIGLYWFLLDKTRKSLKTYFPQVRMRIIIDVAITLFTLLLSFLTVSFAFADNLGAFFTGLGLVSTALVFTLQDFVASFFGWLHIRINHLYGMNDEIIVHTSSTKYSGKVVKVGIFRTYLKIRLGTDSPNTEMMTGRIASFPNHLVLKDAIDNSTRENKIVWHTTSVITTFESNLDLTKKVMEELCDEIFEYTIKNSHHLLDSHPDKKNVYKPKLYMEIDDNGVKFTIWFACNIGYYRELLDKYSYGILTTLHKNNIQLAYKTSRHIQTKINLQDDQNKFE